MDDEFEEYAPNPCVSLRLFFHQLFSVYRAAFQRLDDQGVPALTSLPLAENSVNDRQLSLSRPLPYDAEHRYSHPHPHPHRDGLVSRRDKSITHFQEDLQLRRSVSSSVTEPLGLGMNSEQHSRFGHSESSEKVEDEDVCPTCLDEYTPENPKITTRCSHHFHLGCIYEWLERSENCPICGKEMEFCGCP